MDTERYWIHIHILIHKWSWYRGYLLYYFYLKRDRRESKSKKRCLPEVRGRATKLTTAERPGKLLIGWSARARWKWLQCREATRPTIGSTSSRQTGRLYYTHTHIYIYTIHSRHMTSMSSEISPPQRASFSISISTLRRVPPEQGHCGIAPEQGPALIAVCVSAQRCWVSFIKTERGRISCLSCVRTSKRDGWNRII